MGFLIFSNIEDSIIPISNKANIGMASNTCETTSGGVSIAAIMNITKINIFLFFLNKLIFTILNLVNKTITIGNSNIIPKDNIVVITKLK